MDKEKDKISKLEDIAIDRIMKLHDSTEMRISEIEGKVIDIMDEIQILKKQLNRKIELFKDTIKMNADYLKNADDNEGKE